MKNAIELNVSVDRSSIPAANAETEIKCLTKLWPSMALRSGSQEPLATHICLLFDCSTSMLAGGKLDTAIESAKMIVDQVPESQRLSLIAFQSKINILVDNAAATQDDKDRIKRQIDEIRSLAGGSTNMTDAIKEGARLLGRSASDANVMILLSDGAADRPSGAEKAAKDATKAGIQIFAVGIGAEYQADDLLKLVTPSNGALFGESDIDKISATFAKLIGRIETFVASNARLELTFSENVQAGLAYKASPEQAFIGNMQPDAERIVTFNIGNVERDKEYAFLFLASVPQREPGEVHVCTVRCTFDVPSQGMKNETVQQEVVIRCTDDSRAAEIVDGEVMEVFRRVTITQLAERFVKAYKDGESEQTAKYLGILIRRYDEIGDTALKNHYEDLLSDLKKSGTITNEMLNASVVASTVVAGGGELPHVVDDDF